MDPATTKIFDSIPTCLVVIDEDGAILYRNEACVRRFNGERGDARGTWMWEIVAEPESHEAMRSAVEHALTSGDTTSVEVFAPCDSEQQRWFEWEIRPVGALAAPGLPDGCLVATGHEVTDTREALQDARWRAAKLDGIVSLAVDGIVTTDEQQHIVRFNEAAEQMFGWSAAEVLGKPLNVLLPERHRSSHHAHVDAFARADSTARRMGERSEIYGRRKDGTEFPAEASISRVKVQGAYQFTAIVRDITERRRRERNQTFLAELGTVLAESLDVEQTLSTIAELAVRFMADFCIVDMVGDDDTVERIKAVHRDSDQSELAETFETLELDRSRPHLMSSALSHDTPLLIEDVQPKYVESIAQSETHRSALEQLDARSLMVVPLETRDRIVGAISFVLSDPKSRYDERDLALAKELAARAAIAIDNARLYERARRAVQARDDVLSIVAHDLRNPISGIKLAAQFVNRKLDEDAPAGLAEMARQIEGATDRANRLIQDLLDVARIDAGRLEVQPDVVPAHDIVLQAREVHESQAEEKSLEMDADHPPELPRVYADRGRLLQVLENLIGNAIKFTPRGGRITLRATKGPDHVSFTVADTGPGIDESAIPHLFDRFYQAKQKGRGGAGLGLSICKGIVEAHGGEIWVESTPGVGTRVSFTVPVHEEEHVGSGA